MFTTNNFGNFREDTNMSLYCLRMVYIWKNHTLLDKTDASSLSGWVWRSNGSGLQIEKESSNSNTVVAILFNLGKTFSEPITIFNGHLIYFEPLASKDDRKASLK